MKKTNVILLGLIVVLMFLFVACSSKNQEDIKPLTNSDQMNNAQQTTNENPVTTDENSNTNIANNVNSKTMRYCYSKAGEPVVFTYYIADGIIHSKTTTENQGSIEKIISPNQICTQVAGDSFDDWNCIDNTVSDFNDEKESIAQQTEGALKDIFGFKCNTIDFDETIFSMKK